VGENYENDATYIKEFTGDIKVKSEQLFASMQSVISSINEIAKANNEGSAETYHAAQKLADIKENTANVLSETQALKKSTSMLQNLVLQFQM
jgi:methyl-accepting chemotaxis protein